MVAESAAFGASNPIAAIVAASPQAASHHAVRVDASEGTSGGRTGGGTGGGARLTGAPSAAPRGLRHRRAPAGPVRRSLQLASDARMARTAARRCDSSTGCDENRASANRSSSSRTGRGSMWAAARQRRTCSSGASSARRGSPSAAKPSSRRPYAAQIGRTGVGILEHRVERRLERRGQIDRRWPLGLIVAGRRLVVVLAVGHAHEPHDDRRAHRDGDEDQQDVAQRVALRVLVLLVGALLASSGAMVAGGSSSEKSLPPRNRVSGSNGSHSSMVPSQSLSIGVKPGRGSGAGRAVGAWLEVAVDPAVAVGVVRDDQVAVAVGVGSTVAVAVDRAGASALLEGARLLLALLDRVLVERADVVGRLRIGGERGADQGTDRGGDERDRQHLERAQPQPARAGGAERQQADPDQRHRDHRAHQGVREHVAGGGGGAGAADDRPTCSSDAEQDRDREPEADHLAQTAVGARHPWASVPFQNRASIQRVPYTCSFPCYDRRRDIRRPAASGLAAGCSVASEAHGLPQVRGGDRARHHGPGRPRAQPQERQRRAAPRQARRVHRPVRVGQVEPRVRHDLRRGAAALRRVAQLVRPPVPRPDGQARRRRHRGAVAGDLDRPEVGEPQPALHGRHHHRGLRLPASALRPHRRPALPERRHPAAAPDAATDRRPHPRDGRRHPLPGARAGRARPQGRVRHAARRPVGPGLRARPHRRRDRRHRRVPPARRAARPVRAAQDRDRRRPSRAARGHRAPAHRLARDRARTRRRRRRGRADPVRDRVRHAHVQPAPRVPGVPHVVRGAGAPQLLVQLAVRRVRDVRRARHHVRGRPRARGARPRAVDRRRRDRPVAQRTHPVLPAHARVGRRVERHRPRRAVGEAHGQAAAGGAARHEGQAHRQVQEPLRAQPPVRNRVRGRDPVDQAPPRGRRERLHARAVRGLHARGARATSAVAPGSSRSRSRSPSATRTSPRSARWRSASRRSSSARSC